MEYKHLKFPSFYREGSVHFHMQKYIHTCTHISLCDRTVQRKNGRNSKGRWGSLKHPGQPLPDTSQQSLAYQKLIPVLPNGAG